MFKIQNFWFSDFIFRSSNLCLGVHMLTENITHQSKPSTLRQISFKKVSQIVFQRHDPGVILFESVTFESKNVTKYVSLTLMTRQNLYQKTVGDYIRRCRLRTQAHMTSGRIHEFIFNDQHISCLEKSVCRGNDEPLDRSTQETFPRNNGQFY